MKTIDLKIHLDKIEVVLRNKSVLCGRQVGGMGRIENSGELKTLCGRVMQFETVVVLLIRTGDDMGKKETRLLTLKNTGKCFLLG